MNATWLLVAIVYAIAIFLARRLRADFPWRIGALYYALVLVYLFKPMTGPYVNLPVDILTQFPPWWGAMHHVHVANWELNDLVMQIIPWAHQVREAMLAGHLPLWNPLSGSGYPLLASAQSSALSPLRILTLPLPLGYAFTAEAALKMLIAASFMYGFCRRRWREMPSAVAGACYAFCTFVQVWLHFPLAAAAVWIPAAIVSIDMLFERVTRRRIVAVIAAWTVMALSGHPETVAHTAFVAALFILWLLFVERCRDGLQPVQSGLKPGPTLRRIGALAFAALFVVLIASPFLVPFAEAIRKSKRYQELQERPNAIGYFSDWPSTVILFQPHFFGYTPEDKAWPQARAESITAFAGVLGVGAWLGLLLRAIADRRWRDREMFFILLAPIILGIILAWPGVSTLFHFLFKFAANARLRLMICWIVAALTAAILDDALTRGPRYLLLGNAVSALAMLLLLRGVDFNNAAERDIAMLACLPSLIVITASLLLLVPSKLRVFAMSVVFATVIVELWSASRTWNPVLPAAMMYPSTPMTRFLQRGAPPEQFRITGTSAMFFPNSQAMYDLADIRMHDPMANARYVGLLRSIGGYDTEGYFARWNNTDTTLLNYLNVKYVMTEPGVKIEESDRYKLVYESREGRVYENRDVLPRFFPVRNIVLEFKQAAFLQQLLHLTSWRDTAVVNTLPVENDRMRQDFLQARPPNSPEATLTMLEATTTDYTMRVHAPRYTLVVSSIPFWDGWRVEQNGKRILSRPVNGAFLGYSVPQGDWTIHVYFRPVNFFIAFAVSLLAIAFLTVFVWRSPIPE